MIIALVLILFRIEHVIKIFNRPYLSNGQVLGMVVIRLSVCLYRMYPG